MSSKTVLITGAAQRLGAALARALHHGGMDVVIHYNQSRETAAGLVNELNLIRAGSASAIQADLLAESSWEKIIQHTIDFKDRLDVLINNASAFYPTAMQQTNTAQWEEIIGTNMKAPYFLSQLATPYLREQNGTIINISDIHGLRPLKDYPVYSAAKAGLIMLTRALAKELAPEIRVNAISPGAVLWPEDMSEELRSKIISQTALKRQGDPRDIADAVRYLVFNADYMTGQVLTVDGGRTLFS